MKQRNRLLSLLLALCLLMLPMASALAEGEEAFQSLYQQATREAIDAGLYVQDVYTVELAGLGELLSAEEQDILKKTLESLRLETQTFDDFDAVYHHYALFVSDEQVLSVDVRETEGEQQIQTSLLPGKIFTSPAGEETASGLLIPISPFSLFTIYIPNVPGGGPLSLSPEDAQTLDLLVASYFFEIAGWVGKTQEAMDGTLYATDYPELPETETRDAVHSTFTVNLSATDLKAAMRLMADTFYADEEMQRIVTNYLEAFGVDAAKVRKFADELPLHIRDLKDQEDAVLTFTSSYNEDGDLVGFDGELPQLYEQLPFAHATTTYDAKHEADGLRGQGEAVLSLLEDKGTVTADFSLWEGDWVDDTRSFSYGLDVVAKHADGRENTAHSFLQMDQQINGDVEETHYRMQSVQSASDAEAPNAATLDVSGSMTATLGEDSHFTGAQEHTFLLSGDSAAEVRVKVITTTGSYTVPDFTSGEVIDLMTLPPGQMALLTEEIQANGLQALLLSASLLPPEVLESVRGLFLSLPNQ